MKGALRLAAVDPVAARAGLIPGLPLADAQARTPALAAIPHTPDRDDALLVAALEDFGRFTPMIALDPPYGMMLDVTGVERLFGDEAALARRIQDRARRSGLSAEIAVASTPQAARALCRFGPRGVFAYGQDRVAVRRLPVAALELSEREETALRRAGLKRIGDLDDRDRAPLAARFGADFPARLARVLGAEDIRITPHRPAPPVVVDRVFFEPVSATEDIERVLSDLLIETADRLDLIGQGGRAFQAGFYRLDGHIRRITVRTGRPTRDAPAVLRLFRERLAALSNPLDPGFGFDQIRMAVTVIQPLAARQTGLQTETPDAEDFSRVMDRLGARLGLEAVRTLRPKGSHRPERAAQIAAFEIEPRFLADPAAEAWPGLERDDPPLRPMHLFDPPQPIEAMAEAPDGHPFRFRWRRVVHNVVRAEGPERIAGEWWRGRELTRDYYRVEDRDGHRFWLFRQGFYGGDPSPVWFVHGLFA